jgi:hypothetical protein
MRLKLLIILTILSVKVFGQGILLLDRYNGNKIVNDSILTVWSSDPATIVLTQYLYLENRTDTTLAVFLRKSVNYMNDSTSDYFCFGISCWPDAQVTNIADSILPGKRDSTFASHVVHVRRFDLPLLPPGKSSVTYTFFDSTSLEQPVVAQVTIIYHLSSLGIHESLQKTVDVFPNPAKESVSLSFNLFRREKIKIVLTDITGQILKIESHYMPIGQSRIEMNTSMLNSGVYLAKIQFDDATMISKKLIICN